MGGRIQHRQSTRSLVCLSGIVVLVGGSMACGSDPFIEIYNPRPATCVQREETNPLTPAPLHPVASCDELNHHVRSIAAERLRSIIERQRQTWSSRCVATKFEVANGAQGSSGRAAAPQGAGSTASSSAQSASEAAGPADHSDTNNQVDGVDEADFVKADDGGCLADERHFDGTA